MLVGVPLIVLLDEISPDVRYMGVSMLAFSLAMTTMGFIILPKVVIVSRMRRKASLPRHSSNMSSGAEEGNMAQSEHAGTNDAPQSPGPRVQVVTFD